MKVVLTGATGRIGRHLVQELQARGDTVVVLSRNPQQAKQLLKLEDVCQWSPLQEIAPTAAFEHADAVIHLAGEDVGQRWTQQRKQAIQASREIGTRNLVEGLRNVKTKPPLLISASASGYYGPHGNDPVTENDQPGNDFLAQVCVTWEHEANAAKELGIRVITVRTGIVLDKSGGALAKMLTPFKLGVGGPVGTGNQYLSWIHLADEVGILIAALDSTEFSGPVNAAAPNPVTNREFGKILGRVLKRPAFLPTPGFALKVALGEMSQLVLTGVKMLPNRVPELNYQFKYPELEAALKATLR